jgi:hypothetical protein
MKYDNWLGDVDGMTGTGDMARRPMQQMGKDFQISIPYFQCSIAAFGMNGTGGLP